MPDWNVNGGYGHDPSPTPGATPRADPRPAPTPDPGKVAVSVVRADQPQPELSPGRAE